MSKRRLGNNYGQLIFLPWLFGMVAYWLIIAADPYHLRHNGPTYRLADHLYPDAEWPRLIAVATAQPHDLILFGGSTAMPITPAMMREAFPGARSPINLSYLAQRPPDMPQILPRIAQVAGLEHVILFMDLTLMENGGRRSPTGEMLASLAMTNWHHSGEFGLSTALASLHAIATGTYDIPAWSEISEPEFMLGAKPLSQSADLMRQFRRAVRRHADDVFARSTLTCAQIPYLQTSLVPFLTEMARKNIAVDLVFPAFPYVLYYDWFEFRPPSNDPILPGAVFDQIMTFKKCVIAARDRVGSDGIRVIVMDSEESVAGDLNLYFDTIHPIHPETYRDAIRMIASGDQVITSANIDRYEADLRGKVSRWAEEFNTR
ncbi:MAG: hypothetical protein WB646_17890 [Steroidobacteraceae bacterium]